MKRITSEITFDSLKPLFGSKGNPPYYDPNDIHDHIWKKGKLGIEDNPKIAFYSRDKLNIRDCTYCKICHTIKDKFQSTVGSNKDTIEDIIEYGEIEQFSYVPEIINYQEIKITITKDVTESVKLHTSILNKKLFHNPEGIFDNYVIIEDSEI